ncbi:MAG: molecular chaperone TorD family protein [Trueperaceae bacterium]|nr:MAG: molecular chaperone TorD family protein [Trueperaceae bacterium]
MVTPTADNEEAEEPPGCSRKDLLGPIFQLTAAIFQPPTDLLETDIATGRFAALTSQLADLLGFEQTLPSTFDWDVIRASYVELFVSNPGGLPAPPYTGYALDGALLGPSTRELLTFLARNALVVERSWSELPDHLALVAEAGLLLLAGDRDREAAVLGERFLLPWFECYAEIVSERDRSGFYGRLGRFLRDAFQEVRHEVAA